MKLDPILEKIVTEAAGASSEYRTAVYVALYSLIHGAETEIEREMIDAAVNQVAQTRDSF